MNIILIGFGSVGRGFVEVLQRQADSLRKDQHFAPRIVAVATRSRGSLYCPNGLDLAALQTIGGGALAAYPDQDGLQRDLPVETLIREAQADVLVEASVTQLSADQPALHYCLAALESGKHVVLANKGPVALGYAHLMETAKTQGRSVRFEATVMAGTPTIRLGVEALAGSGITRVRGIFNGTSNFILTQMENGMAYNEALALAQEKGYAEADPSADVDGWDTAAKALILSAAVFGRTLTLDQMSVSGISGLTPADIEAAQQAGERWKLIAEITPDGANVAPMRLPLSDPLARVSGATNAVSYTTQILGEVSLVGPGAGGAETGFGLLSDVLALQGG